MDRKKFIRNSIFGLSGILALKSKLIAQKESTYDSLMDKVGFNHLPTKKDIKTMNYVIHKASSRGHANHGWLDSHHSFSFASYYNPEKMHFGVLRVLNDDIVDPGMGFGTHPHDNMEIISIPLEGDLEHKDSMGNTAVIREGEIQVMSAGTGIKHSEYNRNKDQQVKFLQIWLFPHTKNVTPRYDQIKIDTSPNKLNQILSPDAEDEGVWIHQNAWFHLGSFNKQQNLDYQLKNPENGVYVFLIEGSAEVEGESLNQKDAIGLWDLKQFSIKAEKGSKILLMEVPMKI
jgi:redox-sensitive bicupin YhaK (pirin superfamily)